MKIVVLAGGLSAERDVSLVSASMISKALIRNGHRVLILDLYYGTENIIDDSSFISDINNIPAFTIDELAPPSKCNQLNCSSQIIHPSIIPACKNADLVFLALHGDIGENGKIQAVLSVNNIKYTGSNYDGCLLSMNKELSKILVLKEGINTAKWSLNHKSSAVNFPCVVKPLNGGSSIGITIVNNLEEYSEALNIAKKYDNGILIEEKIEGREFSVGIFNNEPLPVIEISPLKGFYDYKNKYQSGLTKEICPAPISSSLSSELQEQALRIHNILHLHFYSRIDFIVTEENEIFFLEANALPGMTPTSLLPQEAAAQNISYDELCNCIALNAICN